MKKNLSVLAILLVLVSCNDHEYIDMGDIGANEPNPIASFTYKTEHPLYVHFTNTSKDAQHYKWDFGDGKTSTEKSPTHKYSKKGVYQVTLSASYGLTDSGYYKTNKYTKNVTVVEPTKCYITGIIYNNVPVYNEYYNLRCTDDYVLFETLYWYTDWSLLSSANLPFTDDFTNKQQIDFSKSEYVVRLYRNSKPSGKGTQVEYWSIFPSGIKSNFDEKIKKTNGKSSITLNLGWYD